MKHGNIVNGLSGLSNPSCGVITTSLNMISRNRCASIRIRGLPCDGGFSSGYIRCDKVVRRVRHSYSRKGRKDIYGVDKIALSCHDNVGYTNKAGKAIVWIKQAFAE